MGTRRPVKNKKYNTESRSAIFLQHDVDVLNIQYDLSQFRHYFFSSNKSTSLYITGDIPTYTELLQFHYTTQYFESLYCIDKVVGFIKNIGGFPVTGWYIKKINDV